MNLLVEAMKEPNAKADDKFIEMALADIEEEIANVLTSGASSFYKLNFASTLIFCGMRSSTLIL